MELMKNGLSEQAIKRIAKALKTISPEFEQQNFINTSLKGLDILALKERVHHIITALHKYLPDNFLTVVEIFSNIEKVWDFGDKADPLSSFAAWPLIDYVSVYGLEHPKVSLHLLKKLTSLFSAEFAIRPFIINSPNYCLTQFSDWVNDDCEHVRRLVSEGTRPRLPWGLQLKQFVKAPQPNLPLLTALKSDDSLYVRRSVANHLNDIAKDHPDVVIELCKQWQQTASNKTARERINWVIKHATRTLVKNGHPDVFTLLGYKKAQVNIEKFNLETQEVEMGKTLIFGFDIISTINKPQRLIVDFALHFIKANGQQKAKVFKLKVVELNELDTITLTKNFSFKAISTRKYYVGDHKVELLINGKSVAEKTFSLIDERDEKG
jgi:3-methyladenine DNA glycosylase AlkC